MKRDDLCVEFVRSILDYDPQTGALTWRTRVDVGPHWNARFAGKEAGCVRTHRYGTQYRLIRIDDKLYRAHRLAWVIVTGKWPEEEIDHKDGDGLNNRWDNLRAATRLENMRNRRALKGNASGFKGVHQHKGTGRWRAQICIEERRLHLGLFDTPEEAHAAYCHAAKRLHGEFARVA